MSGFLDSQLGLLERQTGSPNVQEVEDLIAFHLTTLERLESHLGSEGILETHRRLVPLFQRWLSSARNTKQLVRTLRNAGHSVSNYDDLLRAMNRSKPIAESFDRFVELNARLAMS